MRLLHRLLLYIIHVSLILAQKFKHCLESPLLSSQEQRKVYIATCETGTHTVGWMKNDSLLAWNVTSENLRKQGISMKNVCEGGLWEHKLLTKPLTFYHYVKQILDSYSSLREKDLIYIIFMDSDTFWSVDNVSEIWNRFDCARNGKDMIVSTETACWMGYYCTKNDTDLWYSNITHGITYSPFANSGVYMGKATLIKEMLFYIVTNNQTYYTFDIFHKVYKFHDQHAVADYSIRVAPHRIQLDYHQQFAATFAVRVSVGKAANPRASAVCKTRDGTLDYHCSDVTSRLYSNRFKFYRVNESSCRVYRHFTDNLPYMTELEGMAPYPLIWHGNGAAKKAFLSLSYSSYKCFIRKRKGTS